MGTLSQSMYQPTCSLCQADQREIADLEARLQSLKFRQSGNQMGCQHAQQGSQNLQGQSQQVNPPQNALNANMVQCNPNPVLVQTTENGVRKAQEFVDHLRKLKEANQPDASLIAEVDALLK
jgi:hypothetical protein